MQHFLLFLLITESYAYSVGIRSTLDLVEGTIKKIPDIIPSGLELIQFSKNIVAGYPFDTVRLLNFVYFRELRNFLTTSIQFF